MKNIFLKAASLGAAFSFLAFSHVTAQPASDTTSLRSVYFSIGRHQVNISSLNDRLALKGYTTFQNFFTTIGLGFQENRDGWVSNFDLSLSRLQEQRSWYQGNRSSEQVLLMMDFQINANFGYEVFKTKAFSFYPTLGFGGGAQHLSITWQRDFDDVLTAPFERNVTLWNNNFLLNAALNADYLISAGETPDNRSRFILIGLRGGYTLAPWSKWTQNNGMVEVSDSPESNMTGAFVQLKFGVSTKAK